MTNDKINLIYFSYKLCQQQYLFLTDLINNKFKIVIIFMEGKKGEFSIFYKKLNGVLLKKKAYAFRMIMLISDESINSTFIVRHYDYQCEAVQLILSILRAKFQKKKLQAFQVIKKHSIKRFKRTSLSVDSKRKSFKSRFQSKDVGVNTYSSYIRSSSVEKPQYMTPSKKTQLNQLFMKVKSIAQVLINPLNQTTSSYQNSSKNQNPQKYINRKIQQLEHNMNQLLYMNDKRKLTNQSTIAETMKKIKSKQYPKSIQVNRFDIFI